MHNKTCPNHSYQFLKDFLFVILMILFTLTSPKYVRADTYYEYLVPQWEYHPGGTSTYTWCPTDPNTQVPDDQYRSNPGTWPSLASFPNDSTVVATTSWPYMPSYTTYQYTLHYSGQEPQTYTAGLSGYGGFIVTDWFSAGEVSNIYMAVRGGHYNYGHGVYMFIQDEKTRHWTKLVGSTRSTISYNIPIEQRYHGRCRIGISFSNHIGSQINTGTMNSTVSIGRIRLTKSPHNYNLTTLIIVTLNICSNSFSILFYVFSFCLKMEYTPKCERRLNYG